jgi:hypothetical protein
MSKTVGRNDPCPCGSGKKFKRCCLDAPAITRRDTPPDVFDIEIIVDTPRGPMLRRVPAASPLRTDIQQGTAAEGATHEAAAVWGLPDFVFRAELARTGSGVRELGDGLVLTRRYALSVQVKSREGSLGSEEKERRWIVKKAAEAIRQADGTVRQLRLRSTQLTNLRGYAIDIDATSYSWVNVVVIDHPSPPEETTLEVDTARHPAVVLLRRDWEFLFEQLKSTTSVAQYLERVAGEPSELGFEAVRYYDLAQADAEAPPDAFAPELVAGGEVISAPLLPLAPAGTDDRRALQILRTLMEDIAVTRLTSTSEADRLRMLSEIDRLPVGQRAVIGRRVLDYMAQVDEDVTQPGLVWRMSSVRAADGRIHLGFGTCSHPYTDPSVAVGLQAWTQLRHYDVLQAAGPNVVDELTTVAVIATPRFDGKRPWDTSVSAVSGPVSFDASHLRVLREHFPGQGALDCSPT